MNLAPPGAGHRAAGRLAVAVARGVTRVTELRCDPPFTFRARPGQPAPGGGPVVAEVLAVASAAGPLGGDELTLDLDVGPGARLAIGSVGATLVLPGPTGRRSWQRTSVAVGRDACLWWAPEPMIVAAGADHDTWTTVHLEAGAGLLWVEELVLGRHGEAPGRLRSRLRVEGPTGPLVATGLDVGRPGWDGPAGTAGARALAQVVAVGQPARRLAGLPTLPGEAGPAAGGPGACRTARSTVADGVVLITVAGSSALLVRRAVQAVVAAGRDAVP